MTDRSPESPTSVTSPSDEQPAPDSEELPGEPSAAQNTPQDEQIAPAEQQVAPAEQNGTAQNDAAQDDAADEAAPEEPGAPADEASSEEEVTSAESATEQAPGSPSEGVDPVETDDEAEEVQGPEESSEDSPKDSPEDSSEDETADQTGSSEDLGSVPQPTTGGVRMSRPTPALPAESRPEEKDTRLSEFFDTLDDRFAEATGRLANVFRRPEPGEQVTPRVDPRLTQGHGIAPDAAEGQHEDLPEDADAQWDDAQWDDAQWDDVAWYEGQDDRPLQDQDEQSAEAPHAPAAEGSPDAPVARPAVDPTVHAQEPAPVDEQLPTHLEEDVAEDVDLPDEETASQLESYEEQARSQPPLPTADLDIGDDATMVTLPPIDAQTGDPRTSRIALPRPPKGDGRPLPWEARQQEAEEARRQDASAARRRAVILEKASAIEAATGQEDEDTDQYADEEEDLYTYIPPYNLPSRDPDPEPRPRDLIRQIFVSFGALCAVVSALWMLGVIGGPALIGGDGLSSLVDGWYSGDLTLLTPDASHYWLWPVIVLGLLGHAVHQWTTTQISTPRQRRSGWLVGAASVLMLVWTAAIHTGLLAVAVLAALAAALALVDAVRQFTLHTARNTVERRLTDATVGLFTGWALVGAMSSISIALTSMGVRIPGFPAILWAMIGLVACIWVGAFYAMTERGRMTIALGLGWGMFWLIFPRLLSENPSVWVAIGAAMGAFIVILATESRRHRINHAERRAAMGRPVDDII